MPKNTNKFFGKTGRTVYACVFAAIEFTLISLILFSSLSKIWVCYSAIAVAFAFALPFAAKDGRKNLFIIAALFLTLVADFFLVIEYGLTGEYVFQCLGVSAFCAVHFFYFLYLYEIKGKNGFLIRIIIRTAVSAIAAVVSAIVLKESGNYLSAVSVVCFCWLIMNIVSAFSGGRKTLLFAFGLLFFALCDAWVGLQCANGVFFDIPEGFIYGVVFPPFNAVWLCYGLAQTFIVLYLITKP